VVYDIMKPELLAGLGWDVAADTATKLVIAELRKRAVVGLDEGSDPVDGRHTFFSG
jgi:hypothetical protein